jgi:arylsulfatase A-like enzyme
MIDLDSVVHGSPYDYDRHVPLLFFGAGIVPGRSATKVRTTDLAPTLAGLAGIAAPAALDGKALLSLRRKNPRHTICGQTARFSPLPAL